jgi:hypothetical protein
LKPIHDAEDDVLYFHFKDGPTGRDLALLRWLEGSQAILRQGQFWKRPWVRERGELGRVLLKTGERMGMETVEHWYVQVRRSRKIRCVPPDEQITRSAAVWKVKRRDLSLADCFALATRKDKAQTLLTADSVLKDAGGRSAVLLAVS